MTCCSCLRDSNTGSIGLPWHGFPIAYFIVHMVDDELAEETVGARARISLDMPPTSYAQARQLDAETELSTIAGLQRLMLKGSHRVKEFTEAMHTSAARRLADAKTIGRALEQHNNLAVDFIKSVQPAIESLRQPIQPRAVISCRC